MVIGCFCAAACFIVKATQPFMWCLQQECLFFFKFKIIPMKVNVCFSTCSYCTQYENKLTLREGRSLKWMYVNALFTFNTFPSSRTMARSLTPSSRSKKVMNSKYLICEVFSVIFTHSNWSNDHTSFLLLAPWWAGSVPSSNSCPVSF